MYIMIRSVEMGEGANPGEAVQALVRIAEYLKEKENMDAKVARNVGGSQNVLHMVIMTDSLDEQPARTAKINKDPEWQELYGGIVAAGLFKPGSLRDKILGVVG